MAARNKISFAVSALRDLEDVLEYYKEQKIPHVGERFASQAIKDIELSCCSLAADIEFLYFIIQELS